MFQYRIIGPKLTWYVALTLLTCSYVRAERTRTPFPVDFPNADVTA